MDTTTMALIYDLAGSVLFTISLRLFSVEHNVFHAIAAGFSAGASVMLFSNGGGIISLIVMVVVFKALSKHDFSEFIVPVFVNRLALVPVLLFFDLNVL